MIKISEILEIGNNKKYIDNLIKECKKENIIPFIGAGMSVPIYELWGDFLIDVSKKSFDSEFPEKIKKRIEAGEYECAASDILEELGEGEFYSWQIFKMDISNLLQIIEELKIEELSMHKKTREIVLKKLRRKLIEYLKLIVWPDSVIENGEMISITALGVDTMEAE